MSEITPGSVMAGFWRWFGVGLFGLLLLAGLILGGWQAGWWFTSHNIARTNRAIQNGYANQTGQLAALDNDLQAIQGITAQIDAAAGQQRADLIAQRKGAANDACKAASQITVSLGGDKAWVERNCTGGALSATSPIATAR